ncbi:MAG TPA: hypothetical protein PLB62_05375 [Candidatus Sumerlaeota bacterium]|nr:hypothetical protein [Candidatus Sumerlaeota bacterium]
MKMTKLILLGLLVAMMAGCAYIPGGTDLSDVADEVGMKNITTGDGTFENYTATGFYTGTEVGIAVGIPYLMKLVELYPVQTNEGLLQEVANAAKNDSADAMINVTPHKETYTGFPLGFIGIYVDYAEGTGIKTK